MQEAAGRSQMGQDIALSVQPVAPCRVERCEGLFELA